MIIKNAQLVDGGHLASNDNSQFGKAKYKLSPHLVNNLNNIYAKMLSIFRAFKKMLKLKVFKTKKPSH
jgi:hypothetical protein